MRKGEIDQVLKRQRAARAAECDKHYAALELALVRLGYRPEQRGGRGKP